MDEIEQRLRTATDATIGSYDAWRKNPKEGGTRESLMEAVHELRKVAARLEIEVAVSERDEMTAKPIPIPPHRSSRKPYGDSPTEDNIGNAADSAGNTAAGHSSGFRDQQGGGHRDHRGGGGAGGGQHRRRRMSMGHGGGGGGGHGGGNGPQGGGGDQG
jgi:hypothetical protein